MTDINSELKARLIIGRKQDGRCRYDPQAKRELVEACLVPGVSVARLALEHGLNANLLRSWVTAYKRKRDGIRTSDRRSNAADASVGWPASSIAQWSEDRVE
jgi:transposase-like protein